MQPNSISIPLKTQSQVPSECLFSLKCLEQALEITRAEPIEVVALDHLHEHSRSISNMLGKDLEEVSTLIEIDQDVEFL